MKYIAKMNSWVQNRNYPITKSFDKKAAAIKYIKTALKIYPYVIIKLTKIVNNKPVSTEVWKTVKNKKGSLSIRKMV